MKIQASETTGSILPALAKVQIELPVIEAVQQADIPTRGGGRMSYSYANLADVWRQAKPILQAHGLVLAHPVRMEDGKCYLQTLLLHATSGEYLGSEISLDVSDSDTRKIGARMSFLRRYCALALLGIPTSDDDEARFFGQLQRAERREEAKERTRALKAGQRGQDRPVSEPPPAPAQPPAPPTQPTPGSTQQRQEPPRPSAPPPQPPEPEPPKPPALVPTVAELVQLMVRVKKKHGKHPDWVVSAIAEALGVENNDSSITKPNVGLLVSEHPDTAADLADLLRGVA